VATHSGSGSVGPAHTVMRPLDIVVPIYRNAGLTRACIDSLLAHRAEVADCRPRLILIGDSPDDAEVEALLCDCEQDPETVVLRNERNVGFIRSVNQGLGLALARGGDVLLVNSDTLTFAGTLSSMLRCAHADPSIGFVSPRSNQASICSLPQPPHNATDDVEAARRAWLALSRHLPEFHFVPTVVGFYCFVSQRVLQDVGMLREDFGVGYEEENDLVMRAGNLGLRAVLANHAFAFHHGSASFNLSGLDLAAQRHRNLERLHVLHPQFLPLMSRYERSVHFRAERLLSGLLPDAAGRLKIAFDLTGLEAHEAELAGEAAAAITALARYAGRLRLSIVCTARAFDALGLAATPDLHREDSGAGGLHAIAVRFGSRLEAVDLPASAGLAPIVMLAVAGTAVEDCAPLSARNDASVWDEACASAHGFVFATTSARRAFGVRHPRAAALPCLQPVFPQRLAAHGARAGPVRSSTVFVWGHGQHLPDDGVVAAITRLSARHRELRFVAFGSAPAASAEATWINPQRWSLAEADRQIAAACLVIVPAREGGFDTGLLRALAAGRAVVARATAAHRELLSSLDRLEGVTLFDHDGAIDGAFEAALAADTSNADDGQMAGWAEWADAFADFCREMTSHKGVFERLALRLAAVDAVADRLGSAPHASSAAPGDGRQRAAADAAKPVDLDTLMAMEPQAFVRHAYATLLGRPADETGFAFYLGQLRDGVDRLEILRSFSVSPEGRARDARLAGLAERLAERSRPSTRIIRRLLGR
jgi:GT2 family glycosyltransferase